MTQCSLLMYPGLLPAYLILQLRLWFYFYNYSDLPLPNQYLIWPPLLLTTYLDKASLEKVFFFSFLLAVGSLEVSSCYVHHFGKQGQVQGN